MKNLLITGLFFCFLSFVHAQDKKPTKEETIAFINRTLNECKGFELPWAFGNLNSANFSGDKLEYRTSAFEDAGRKGTKFYDYIFIIEDLRWDKLDTASIKFNKEERNASYYEIMFETNIKWTEKSENDFRGNPPTTKTNFQINVSIFIPEHKAISIKKALLRLSELAKEENKDPFAN